ncbi:MAG: outer membrane beta-barrel protein [Xanthobacteraceae bacterium]|nr:outer membrane beta-barrel protein [Xanthobacteraceae bacterium]
MRALALALLASTTLGFVGQNASAADLARRAPVVKAPVAPVVPSTWTGCYLGGNVGYGRAKAKYFRPSDGANDGFHTADGFVGGGQIGCDYQFAGNFVIGVQGMGNWANLNGSHSALLAPWTEATDTSWFATATGRLGVTLAPSWLVYVKGGAAWMQNEYTRTLNNGGVVLSAKSNRSGWTVGGGLEWMFAPNWSVFAEYNFMDFGTKRVAFTPGVFAQNIDERLEVVLVGINYRFTGWR